MAVSYREMTIADYDDVFSLWTQTKGMGLNSTDSRKNIERYLNQNPGGSFVAIENNKITGTILCGHDGRRGYVHHLAVEKNHRNKRIANSLVDLALKKLLENGIVKCHVFVFADNVSGVSFWEHMGWTNRKDITLLSKLFGDDALDNESTSR
jgi:ribosomal protein S18 acetylase RimI-like enzyme